MRADAEANRRDLLDTAWRLFAEHGAGISLRTVATEAGVGIGTLYRNFPAREDLVRGVIGEVERRVGALSDACLGAWDDDPAAAWTAFVRDIAALEFGALAFQLAPYAERAGLVVDAMAMRDRILAGLVDVLDRAVRAGLLREGVEPPRFFAGLAMISRPLPVHADELLPGQREWIVEVYLRGLAP